MLVSAGRCLVATLIFCVVELLPLAAQALQRCLADDREGRIRSDGYSPRNLETIGIDLLYKTCVARDVEPASGKTRWIM
uniref:Secreted protein n=1 Tax=Aegilops tauschii subsp. strangulata TaxID=200361 RepID=A0A452XY34_AEGTS